MPTVLGSTPHGRPLRRRLRGVLVAGCVAAALTACSDTSFDAQTNAVYDPGIGTNARGGGVDVLNALIVDNGDGTGTLAGTLVLNPGEFDAGHELTTVTLSQLEVTTLDDKPVTSNLTAGGVTLEPNEPVKLGEDALATVSGDNVAAGDMVTLDLTFDRDAQPVSMDIPVVERTEMYDDVAEAPAA